MELSNYTIEYLKPYFTEKFKCGLTFKSGIQILDCIISQYGCYNKNMTYSAVDKINDITIFTPSSDDAIIEQRIVSDTNVKWLNRQLTNKDNTISELIVERKNQIDREVRNFSLNIETLSFKYNVNVIADMLLENDSFDDNRTTYINKMDVLHSMLNWCRTDGQHINYKFMIDVLCFMEQVYCYGFELYNERIGGNVEQYTFNQL